MYMKTDGAQFSKKILFSPLLGRKGQKLPENSAFLLFLKIVIRFRWNGSKMKDVLYMRWVC